ncbi:S-layer homology domain-containing protein [Alteribacillus iranensis]|uniref:S-layer homology domain-containing protein n=1 Tax=Alteribacillus iranensis TaxID=930128 RepID=A0A1I2EI03_9BACI|nr:S-layer homology domain-containing protein [Alteribacillus iranensis]SFE92267.1 S-layer homology domain-containing protein [Alteribacillus iranensis]
MNKRFIISLFLLTLMLFISPHIEAESTFSDIGDSHWAEEEILYITENGIANGYQDGTFRPKENVTRGQTAKMIVSALGLSTSDDSDVEFNDVDRNHSYYPYIAAVAKNDIMNGSNGSFRPNKELSRAEMAVVLSRAFRLKGETDISFADISNDYWAHSSIQRLVNNGITSGYVNGNFGPSDHTTRAHFSVFLARCLNESFRVEEINTPPSDVDSEQKAWHFRGITMGDRKESVIDKLGEPEKVEVSRYGFKWHIYHDNYSNYVQYGFRDDKVVAIYSNQDTWIGDKGLRLDKTKTDVIEKYGDPLSSIKKGGDNFSIESSTAGTYLVGGRYTTFFYDVHRGNKITAILLVNEEEERAFRQFYAEPTKALKESYERQIFYLANAQRKRFSKPLLQWDDVVAGTARSHSANMSGSNFFDHMNPDGEDPFDRMASDGVRFYNAAENIAYGQVSPLYAHQSWMNSESHRQALLGDYSRLGVGVAFHEIRKQPYYTQNFYTPR